MIAAIVAMSENRVIGNQNQLPWHLPADLAHFKKITTGHSILMGRKTYESIGRPLPNRTNIIMTHNQQFQSDGCIVVNTITDAVKEAELRQQTLFIIGGAEIFKAYLSWATQLYLTVIHHHFKGDTFFESLSDRWEEISREDHQADEKNPYDYSFMTYQQKNNSP